MEKTIIVDSRMPIALKDRVEHQLVLKLQSIRGSVKKLNVRLSYKGIVSECAVDAALSDQQKISFAMTHADPESCIASALARLRREVLRTKSLSKGVYYRSA
jgi:ribosome-associated translation inhibitor RaiA